ncbi:MAG: hypothetical protein JWN03_1186 [Nocardia sp.]|uniref:hypothetical protein n=1 Tax=Nocardia sp. TaxID=1821 RepID=UPI0026126646|nr:hypothetical protein [Nocardia sp.]MCU1640911.1 hypothetical protein [Nocardia sp.]
MSIVSWTDSTGATRWADDQSKAYRDRDVPQAPEAPVAEPAAAAAPLPPSEPAGEPKPRRARAD